MELTKPNFRRRRRISVALLVALCVPAHFVALYALACGITPRTHEVTTRTIETVQTIHTERVVTVPTPIAIPVATPTVTEAPRDACPPPRTDAPRLSPAQIHLDANITGVHASPSNAGWVAAWNDTEVFLSTDAGRTFARVLDGPGEVRSAGIDCFGRTIVVRASGIGIRDGAREQWRALPGLQLQDFVDNGERYPRKTWVVGGGPDVVVVGYPLDSAFEQKPRVAISSDGGASWRYHDVDTYFEGSRLTGRQRANGRIDLALEILDCMFEGRTSVTIANGIVTKRDESAATYLAWGTPADAAGRRWTVACGRPWIERKGVQPPVCEPAP